MKDTSQTIPFNTNNTIACKRFMEAKIDGILIIMCRKIRLILVCLIAISSLQSQAQALYGTTGLLHAPTAEMQKDKTFMVGGNVLHLVPLQYLTTNEIKYTFNYYLYSYHNSYYLKYHVNPYLLFGIQHQLIKNFAQYHIFSVYSNSYYDLFANY